MLRIIQLGITLCDEDGNSPEGNTWQFNFHFNLSYVDDRVSGHEQRRERE
jgi:hypothetical protein